MPSREMVSRLADSLDLPMRERNALLIAAGFAPAYSHTDLDHDQLSVVRDSLQRIVDGQLPFPGAGG